MDNSLSDSIASASVGSAPIRTNSGDRRVRDGVDDLIDGDTLMRRLTSLGYVDVQLERLDDAVLGGFVRFVQRQRKALARRAQVRQALGVSRA